MKNVRSTKITKISLLKLYIEEKNSMMQIAQKLNCSQNKVVYWMDEYKIPRRSIAEAIYLKQNPNGDPFKVVEISTNYQATLYGLGIGLYWGEGNKANKYAIRLGNTDPALIKTFMNFLIELYGIDKNDFRFSLQIFSDIDPKIALNHWINQLDVKKSQFYRLQVTISGSIGTYRKKSKYGVAQLYYHNKKLRDIIVESLPR